MSRTPKIDHARRNVVRRGCGAVRGLRVDQGNGQFHLEPRVGQNGIGESNLPVLIRRGALDENSEKSSDQIG